MQMVMANQLDMVVVENQIRKIHVTIPSESNIRHRNITMLRNTKG